MRQLEKKFNTLMSIISCVSLMVIVFAIGYQIVLRLGKNATPWSEELAQIGMIFMVVFGLYRVERDNEHLRMELIFSLFPKAKPILTIIGNFFQIALAGLLIYSEILFLPSVSQRLTQALKIPMRYIHGTMLVCFVIWIIAIIVQTIFEIAALKRGDKEGN